MIHQQLHAIETKTLSISSPAFTNNSYIPSKFTCEGKNVNPPLQIQGIPANAKSLAIIVEDPDAPHKIFKHWLVWNIPVTNDIKENSAPGIVGMNDFRLNTYKGPCPPSGLRVHRYIFKVFALDKMLNIPATTNAIELEDIMDLHIIAFGELIGLYKKMYD